MSHFRSQRDMSVIRIMLMLSTVSEFRQINLEILTKKSRNRKFEPKQNVFTVIHSFILRE
jgi:hypothetical protein